MAQAAPIRRRWFQFGLRTMFLLVTIFAVWLGWELHQVRERDRLVKSPEFLRLFEYQPPQMLRVKSTSYVRNSKGETERVINHEVVDRPPRRKLPYLKKMLGAEPIVDLDIFLPEDRFTAQDARRIQSIFPECEVAIIPAASH